MKKIFFLLLPIFCFSQNTQLTIYKNGFPKTNEYTVPLTYHDYNEVGPAIQSFCINELKMSLDENDAEIKEGDSIIYMKFTENGINKNFEKMRVDMHMITVGNDAVFSKVIFTGGFDVVTKFWAYFWHTTPKFKYNSNVGLLAENNFLSDKIELFRTKSGARIIVTNTSFTPDKFWSYVYENRKNQNNTISDSKPAIIEDPEPTKEIIKKAEPKQKFEYLIIPFSKSKKGYEFQNKIVAEIEDQVKKDFLNDKNGNYTAYYDVFFLDDKISKIKLKTRTNR